MKITRRQLRRLINEAIGDDLPGGPFEFTEPDDELSGVTLSTDAPQQGMRVRDFIDYLGEFDDLAPIFVSRAHGGDLPAYPSIVDGFVDLSAGRFSEDSTEVGEDPMQAVMIIHPDFLPSDPRDGSRD